MRRLHQVHADSKRFVEGVVTVQIPSKYRGLIYVVLATVLAALLALGFITAEQITQATDEALMIADAVAKLLAAVALVLARINLSQD